MQLEIKPLDNPQILLDINNSALPYVNALDSGKAQVYSQPPNTASLKFHQVMGYREVGTPYMLSEGKTVVKLLKYAERARRRV